MAWSAATRLDAASGAIRPAASGKDSAMSGISRLHYDCEDGRG